MRISNEELQLLKKYLSTICIVDIDEEDLVGMAKLMKKIKRAQPTRKLPPVKSFNDK